ncbi:hypothetical protein KC19_1G061500 [Ceratodon purpureus]|uniref:Uncharacterized protein n=1 Tax=Ceratodon purpureus TaxID=3225 RepID=A0A8T0J5B5_CERPU|nr:hypothetical protein KC19_1G061500 [Ceratodon purpureus]
MWALIGFSWLPSSETASTFAHQTVGSLPSTYRVTSAVAFSNPTCHGSSWSSGHRRISVQKQTSLSEGKLQKKENTVLEETFAFSYEDFRVGVSFVLKVEAINRSTPSASSTEKWKELGWDMKRFWAPSSHCTASIRHFTKHMMLASDCECEEVT